jgi:parallel beta-helix repeat protein
MIIGNTMLSNYRGIVLYYSFNNNITSNEVSSNEGYGIYSSEYSSNNAITENTVLDNGGDGIYLSDYSSNNTITENAVLNNRGDGIYLFYKNGKNIIMCNSVSNNSGYGIFLRDYNDNNIIANNNVFWNDYDGIKILWSCDYNNITGNTVGNNDGGGIYIKDISDHNIIMKNNLSSNKGDGILLHWGSDHNIITGNTVTNNQNGIVIRYSSDRNIITNNTVSSNNGTGISLTWVYYWGSSDNNLIYHNNLINNTKQAYDNGTNSWDNGSVDGGNYWSDYICTGNPSNGCQPYNISGDAGAQDRFPFMNVSGWLIKASAIFDTCAGTYPSTSGTHNGTIKPNQPLTVQNLYTYPCAGTGGHTEYAKIYNNTWSIESPQWVGYQEDGGSIYFNQSFTLVANETYNYTICTGSYPQIHHTAALQTENGWINCTSFVDVNGKEHKDWIPAIRLC